MFAQGVKARCYLAINRLIMSLLWAVKPDGRGPGTLLNGCGHVGSGRFPSAQRIPRGPAAAGVFQYPRIIKALLLGVELWVAPKRFQLRRAAVGGNRAIRQIHFCTVVRTTMGRRINLQTIGTRAARAA